jgi:S-adenosylmethionine:tRNA ribosyltransferase-isomerase
MSTATKTAGLEFELPPGQEASEPPEARGLARDGVRLLVADGAGVRHSRFDQLGRFLSPGDLLVVNTSATLAAAVDGRRADGRAVTVHFSTRLDDGRPDDGRPDDGRPDDGRPDDGRPDDGRPDDGPDGGRAAGGRLDGGRAAGGRLDGGRADDGWADDGIWLAELRPPGRATGPVTDARPGERISLPAGAALDLLAAAGPRLWRVRAVLEGGAVAYLAEHGRPITYAYLRGSWPLRDYQTVFARDPGSAEMPSAGRPFSAELVTSLAVAGVVVTPITLHTGVSSLESGEPPLREWFRVPQPTAELVTLTRAAGRRVIAVGTTVTRALESAADRAPGGMTGHGTAGHGTAGRGTDRAGGYGPGLEAAGAWTDLVLGPQRPARVVDGIITGWHAPGASHLDLLTAVAGVGRVSAAYREAIRHGYLWHEFGDSCLLLP